MQKPINSLSKNTTIRPHTQSSTQMSKELTTTTATTNTTTITTEAPSKVQPENPAAIAQNSASNNFTDLAINMMTQYAARNLTQDQLETLIGSLESLRDHSKEPLADQAQALSVQQGQQQAAAAVSASNNTLINQENLMKNFAARNLTQAQLGQLKSLLTGTCWRDSFGRGGGESVSTCESNEDKDGSLCYPKCQEGYSGVGPVCWQICKLGFRDSGVFCIRDLDIYSKGCCCLADGKCCRNCRANYTDDGCTCRRAPVSYTKKSYGRGTGTGLKCKENWELNGALCYPICQDGYSGSGPVCWFLFFYKLYSLLRLILLFTFMFT